MDLWIKQMAEGINEQSFSVSYSGVLIEAGAIRRDKPQGFATLHYDNTPSPISPLGGGTDSIFGSGGVLAGISTAFGLAKSGNFLRCIVVRSISIQNSQTWQGNTRSQRRNIWIGWHIFIWSKKQSRSN